jgi:very-short-patch-repair endonuclease
VARWQLLRLAVAPAQIDGWVKRGRLRPLFRGVYLVGPVFSPHAYEMAAVLAYAPGAALSHDSGVYIYELLPYPAQPGPLHVTVTGRRPGRHQGIHVHRATLLPHEVRERHNVPVTSPARTLLDFAGGATDDDLEAAVAEAFALRLINRDALLRAIVPGRRGAARLRSLVDAGPKRTRSHPEHRLLTAVLAADLPGPLTNHMIGPWEVDLYWPKYGLVVEVDGYAAHSSRTAFERDRRKDAYLTERGLTVQRFTASVVRDDLKSAVDWIGRALERLGYPP